ncbi:MAG: hypothetical protein QOE27_1855 [Solirubrobacteraceae bacterium]|nr:hypothetical protein [Solirubrobacteraceae bacterium]
MAAVAGAATLPASAAPTGRLVPRGERVAGRTYLQWQVAAWQWQLGNLIIPRGGPNPTFCTIAGQTAPVWFLGASFNTRNSVTGACAIPAGRFILVASPDIVCSTVEPPPFHATTDAGLRRCARAGWRSARARHAVTLDGVALRPPGFVVATPAFSFTMPGNDNYLNVPGITGGRAAAFGYADMLRPLRPGRHTLVRVTRYAGGPPKRTTWYLVVA